VNQRLRPVIGAQAALFLASGEAGFLTGATVLVNGGTVM